MSNFMEALENATNYTTTLNGAITHKSTLNPVLDLFSMGGAYRRRSEEDCILLFKKAYETDRLHALRCLFYLGDVRGGQGERRFFRVCLKWLAKTHPEDVRTNLQYIPFFRRWDDLYVLDKTPLENDAYQFIKEQLALDVQSKTPSLLAKWLKSENTSSADSQYLGMKTRKFLNMTPRQYRKTLSILRKRINVLERLMSANEWDKIEFDKIPSKAGMKYKNAFARHDIERAKAGARTYESFAKDETTKVNAKALYPYECVNEAFKVMGYKDMWGYRDRSVALDDTQRLMANKYWDNLTDYFQGKTFNGIALIDTSGSMFGNSADAPLNIAVSLGMYCAERNSGPYAGKFLSFESTPHLIDVEGVDFCDKVYRISGTAWGGSTNMEAAFDLLLQTAIQNHCSQEDIPENLIIISDMEFNSCVRANSYGRPNATLMEHIKAKWEAHGYQCPNLTFWCVNSWQNNIPMKTENGITFVSGCSPVTYEMIMTGKTSIDLMLDKLDSDRYSVIR